MHFGNLTTNRAESAHAKLKKCLGSSQGDFESCWNTVNALVGLQHVQIRASFEQSLNVVEHNFHSFLFRELRRVVSRKALNIIFEESERANEIGTDITLCGCVIKSTHGLPCAHEIAECLRDLRPISPSSLHPSWFKLDLRKSQNNSFEVSIDDEINAIQLRFNDCDQSGKLALKRKLRELGNPETTFLVPPLEKAKTKGRRSSKKSDSTRRDPSYFEIIEQAAFKHEENSKKLIANKHGVSEKGKKLIVKRENQNIQFSDAFPLYIRRYILNIFDVKSDGHCDFRVIASLLGFGEDAWSKVRDELIEELCNNRAYYVKFYGSSKVVAELLDALSCSVIPAPFKNWMVLPDMGHLVATRYNVVLVHISKKQCWTYLPLRSKPPPQSQQRVIAIGFVNDNHFVQVVFDQAGPIPPIVPNWKYQCQECARGWDTPYLARIKAFSALIPRDSNSGSDGIYNLDGP